MAQKILKLSGLLIMIFVWRDVYGQELSFEEVWQRVSGASPSTQGAELSVQAAYENQNRAQRHWLPTIYIDAKSYQTDDPGANFFGILEQRKVESADFATDSLNHPGTEIFTRGAIGIDLPIYEGGMKKSQETMSNHNLQSEKYIKQQVENDQYAQTALAYGSIAVVQKQIDKLKVLIGEVSGLIKRYQIGQRSNPVGYSGLLGMKSLANRLSGLIEKYEATENSAVGALKTLGVDQSGWSPKDRNVQTFIDKYLDYKQAASDAGSFRHRADFERTKSLEAQAKVVRAGYLPRIGAFAESYVFNGDRDTSNGYSAGVYLKWNIFDPSVYGAYKQAKLQSMAVSKYNEAEKLREDSERISLFENQKALISNLKRIEESEKLLAEQSSVAVTLFRNGSISALQFVEILNRRADLISDQTDAELSLLNVSTGLVVKSKFEIPVAQNVGGK